MNLLSKSELSKHKALV